MIFIEGAPGPPDPPDSPEPRETPAAEHRPSGRFRTDTGPALNIVVNWTLSGSGEETRLHIALSAEGYSLQTREIWQGAVLSIGGETYEFDTEAVDFSGPGQGENPLGEIDVTLDSASLPAEASVTWRFQGSYGGEELNEITATGTIG